MNKQHIVSKIYDVIESSSNGMSKKNIFLKLHDAHPDLKFSKDEVLNALHVLMEEKLIYFADCNRFYVT